MTLDMASVGTILVSWNTLPRRLAGPDFAWFPTPEHRLRAQVLGSWTTAQPSNGSIVKGDLRASHAGLADWTYRGAKWEEYLDFEDVGRDFRADNGFFGQNAYRRLYSETTRKFRDLWGFNEVSPYLFADYKTGRNGERRYQQNNVGLRFGLPRATTIWLEARVNNLIAVREGGGLRKRDQVYAAIETNPFPWLGRLFTEVAYGDRLDVFNNRIGRGYLYGIQASVRPHPRAELEYQINNDVIDSKEPVVGSKHIIVQRAQQLLAIWHFSARQSLRTIVQSSFVKRSPSLWEDPTVSHHEKQQAISLVYGYRRGLGVSLYVGGSLARRRNDDSGVSRHQTELFVKGSWTFDVL